MNGAGLGDHRRERCSTCWGDELRRPTTAIVIRTDEVFMHCAKAFRRGRVWDAASWDELADAPDGLDVLSAQGLVASNNAETRVIPRAEPTPPTWLADHPETDD